MQLGDDSTAEANPAQKALADWVKEALGPQLVKDVKVSDRLSKSPAIIVDHESPAMRRMMRMIDT